MPVQALIDFPQGSGRCHRAFFRPRQWLQADRLADVPRVIAAAHEQARAGAWVLGFVAYEAAPAFDAALVVGPADTRLPLAAFAVFAQPGEVPAARAPAALQAGAWAPLLARDAALEQIEMIRRAIAAGDVYQVNLTTRLRTRFTGTPAAYFDCLRRAQPDAYCLYLDGGPWQLLSVSPELFFDWTPDGAVTTRPMKGTAARHADPRADAAARQAMQASAKERAENLMIVDLLRSDLGRIAVPGSVHVPALFEAQALPTAWQMTSTVCCRSRAGVGLADVFGALFPCGSVTGAPKVAAMSAIRALEVHARGVYCGAVGVLRPGGHATFNVGIRTVLVDGRSGSAECGVGSGITWDSRGAAEWEEWQVKQRFLERAGALSAPALRHAIAPLPHGGTGPG